MNREEEVLFEVAENWRKSERMAIIKFFVWRFLWLLLGCAAVVTGIAFFAQYMEEHKPVPTVYCNKQTYNGHDYLFLASGEPGLNGVVHDPDCACHNSAEKRQSVDTKPKKSEDGRYIIMPTFKETSTGSVSIPAR